MLQFRLSGAQLLPLALLVCTAVQGATIYVNNPSISIIGTPTDVFNAKYRVSNTAFDQSIDNGLGTGTAANTVSANLGTRTQLSGRTYQWTIDYIYGQGFVYSLQQVTGGVPTGTISRVSWGTFTPAVTGTNAPRLGTGTGLLPNRSFNTIELSLNLTPVNGQSAASASVSHIIFTSSLLQSGTFVDPQSITLAAGGSAVSANQWMFANTDLSLGNWTLTGQVNITRNFNSTPDNTFFQVSAYQANATLPNPESGTLVMVGAGLSLVLAGLKRQAPRP
jgi:hypothetical protein